MRHLFVFLVLAGLLPLTAAASLKVVNGRVDKVALEESELTLSFRHPVTGRDERIVLQVGETTGFSEDFRLDSLRPNDPVSVDYEEGPDGSARAVSIRRVPIRGVPKSLSR